MTEKTIRKAGVLLPIFALPSRHGIGTLGREAYRFVDFLHKAGQRMWQLLPLTPTGYGDSPYQSVSAFAGNPYFIDLEDACRFLGISGEIDLYAWDDDDVKEQDRVDYGKLYQVRYEQLRKIYAMVESRLRGCTAYNKYIREASSWLCPFVRFMALRRRFEEKPWQLWPEPYKSHRESDDQLTEEDKQEEGFWRFTQYLFHLQYCGVKEYAKERSIELIGDMPLYMSLDSADVWSNQEQFLLDDAGYPTQVAGVPPDIFSEDGQRWGNPLYRWDMMEQDGFSWWRRRMAHAMSLYDTVRIDHFIGLINYYAISVHESTARHGEWRKAPGEILLKLLQEDGACMIAEDLGVLSEDVIRVRNQMHLPGMYVLAFAFDSDSRNRFLPWHYEKNAVVYSGTHDNETLVGYLTEADYKVLAGIREYFSLETENPAEMAAAIIRAGYMSVCDRIIVTMQDLMGLGNQSRCNTPATETGNWQFRLPDHWESSVDAAYLYRMARLYDRLP